MVSMVFVGYLIGSFTSGKFADEFGRKAPLQYASVGLFFSAIASAFAPEFISFTIFRFFLLIKTCIHAILSSFF